MSRRRELHAALWVYGVSGGLVLILFALLAVVADVSMRSVLHPVTPSPAVSEPFFVRYPDCEDSADPPCVVPLGAGVGNFVWPNESRTRVTVYGSYTDPDGFAWYTVNLVIK